ncbi:unnamed protein product [Cochlearia groenlandica]
MRRNLQGNGGDGSKIGVGGSVSGHDGSKTSRIEPSKENKNQDITGYMFNNGITTTTCPNYVQDPDLSKCTTQAPSYHP